MYIAIPHQGRPHWGRECSGGHDISDGVDKCDADCDGCRDLRDSHCCLGTTSRPHLCAWLAQAVPVARSRPATAHGTPQTRHGALGPFRGPPYSRQQENGLSPVSADHATG